MDLEFWSEGHGLKLLYVVSAAIALPLDYAVLSYLF
jgi:hypothetical protein